MRGHAIDGTRVFALSLICLQGRDQGGGNMLDDPKQAARPDKDSISTDEEQAIKYWSEQFGVNRVQLLDAVNTVGRSAQAVREHLGKGSQ
jgi:hypothetical protein